MRNISLEKSYKNCGGETITRLFSKKKKRSYLWINNLKCIQFVFIVCQVEDNQNILKLGCRPFPFTSYKTFVKNKKRSATSLIVTLSA